MIRTSIHSQDTITNYPDEDDRAEQSIILSRLIRHKMGVQKPINCTKQIGEIDATSLQETRQKGSICYKMPVGQNTLDGMKQVRKLESIPIRDTTVCNLEKRNDRLNTFLFRWVQRPGLAWMGPLADAGFHYPCNPSRDTEVQCIWCKIKTFVDHWQPKETPQQAHARISPNCEFVKKNNYQPKNPIFGSSTDVASKRTSQERMDTFLVTTVPKAFKWKCPPDLPWPSALAEAGFQYPENPNGETEVQCFMCKIRTFVHMWPPNETPQQAHARINPDCEYVKEKKYQMSLDAMNSQLAIDNSNVKYPLYRLMYTRLGSFEKWKHSNKQTPKSLADAGYFFTGPL